MARTIKKYANRRLYDMASSRHVTVAGIHQLVAAGEDVVVVDDASGRDITRSILLQVVVDAEKGPRPLLSTAVLNQMIRSYGHPAQTAFESCLEHAVDVCRRTQDALASATASADVAGTRPVELPVAAPHRGALGARAADEQD